MISTFDDDIGFVAGLPIGTRTMAHAFKEFGASVGTNYTAYYNGKWGIGVRYHTRGPNVLVCAHTREFAVCPTLTLLTL
jgi:hypothetical protein